MGGLSILVTTPSGGGGNIVFLLGQVQLCPIYLFLKGEGGAAGGNKKSDYLLLLLLLSWKMHEGF